MAAAPIIPMPKGFPSALPNGTTEKPVIYRVGLQGDAMTVSVCTENPMIDEDMKLFSQALAQDDELLGERLAVLARILKELNY